jgi:hypothetical protein
VRRGTGSVNAGSGECQISLVALTLDAAACEAGDEVPLREEEDEDRRERDDDRRGGQLVPSLRELEDVCLKPDRQRVRLVRNEEDVGESDLVPGCDEGVEAGDGKTRQ